MANQKLGVLDGLRVEGDSTLSANLVVDTNTLVVDSVLNSIGIGKLPASGRKLDVNGNVYCSYLFANGVQLTSVNADKLDNLDSLQFLRSDEDDTYVGSTNGKILGIGDPAGNTARLLIRNGDLTFVDNQTLNFGTGGDVTMICDGTKLDVGGVGNTIFYTDLLYINATNDRVGINTAPTTAGYVLDVGGATRIQGSLSATGDVTAYASDKRLKQNIKPIEDALNKIDQINGYTFEWNLEKCSEVGFEPSREVEHGVLAQEIQEIMPDLIADSAFDPEYKTVRYDRLTALLISAVKELKKEIEDLKSKL